ncbi:unnamed protein product [Didymodactylos carnosus]|uniref:TIR domain-containing protein n=1 Tax=Didymodactylos carnosus TaxID=1234261 RepID=A0A814BBZ1_9BILA|nr:unnamed protein product [Didymodactylos carnosus]CAF3705562.1 unnamed protein product [Didymodactylos carnosus]
MTNKPVLLVEYNETIHRIVADNPFIIVRSVSENIQQKFHINHPIKLTLHNSRSSSPLFVFLSYEWSHQKHVLLLKQHLESIGIDCWLDIEQLGGGTKLLRDIEFGMRATDLVVCCINRKYSSSEMCCREVTLAVQLEKPIIPLLFEDIEWPPIGLSTAMAEYVYIRFYLKQNEKQNIVATSEQFWLNNKFDELVRQIYRFS